MSCKVFKKENCGIIGLVALTRWPHRYHPSTWRIMSRLQSQDQKNPAPHFSSSSSAWYSIRLPTQKRQLLWMVLTLKKRCWRNPVSFFALTLFNPKAWKSKPPQKTKASKKQPWFDFTLILILIARNCYKRSFLSLKQKSHAIVGPPWKIILDIHLMCSNS